MNILGIILGFLLLALLLYDACEKQEAKWAFLLIIIPNCNMKHGDFMEQFCKSEKACKSECVF